MGAEEELELRVAAKTSVGDLGAVISHAVYDGKPVSLRAIGAGPVAQAMKAVAVARGYVAPRGIDLAVIPGFMDITVPNRETGEDERVTGMRFRIVTR